MRSTTTPRSAITLPSKENAQIRNKQRLSNHRHSTSTTELTQRRRKSSIHFRRQLPTYRYPADRRPGRHAISTRFSLPLRTPLWTLHTYVCPAPHLTKKIKRSQPGGRLHRNPPIDAGSCRDGSIELLIDCMTVDNSPCRKSGNPLYPPLREKKAQHRVSNSFFFSCRVPSRCNSLSGHPCPTHDTHTQTERPSQHF